MSTIIKVGIRYSLSELRESICGEYNTKQTGIVVHTILRRMSGGAKGDWYCQIYCMVRAWLWMTVRCGGHIEYVVCIGHTW